MRPSELPGVRRKAYEGPPCALEDHTWDQVWSDDLVLLIICTSCGRTPLEMLAELKIEGVR